MRIKQNKTKIATTASQVIFIKPLVEFAPLYIRSLYPRVILGPAVSSVILTSPKPRNPTLPGKAHRYLSNKTASSEESLAENCSKAFPIGNP